MTLVREAIRRAALAGVAAVLACGDDAPAVRGDAVDASSSSGSSSSGGVDAGGTTVAGDDDGSDAAATAGSSGEGSTADGGSAASGTASGRDTTTDGGTTIEDTSSGDDGTTGTSTGGSTTDDGASTTGDGSSSTSDGASSTGADGSSTGDGASTTDGDGSGTDDATTGEPEPVCVDLDLGGALVTVSGDNVGVGDDYQPGCVAGTGGRDVAHLFTAPADGFYAFDTLSGTAFDSVLSVRAGEDCDAPEVACNDDVALGDPGARVAVYLFQDETRMVVVDGWDASQVGAYALDVDAVLGICHEGALPSVGLPSSYAGTTVGAFDKLTASCSLFPGTDRVIRFVAPVADTYRFDTNGSSFDTVLSVRTADCGAVELACDDDAGTGDASLVQVTLAAGQQVSVLVDGFSPAESGAFTLTVTQL